MTIKLPLQESKCDQVYVAFFKKGTECKKKMIRKDRKFLYF